MKVGKKGNLTALLVLLLPLFATVLQPATTVSAADYVSQDGENIVVMTKVKSNSLIGYQNTGLYDEGASGQFAGAQKLSGVKFEAFDITAAVHEQIKKGQNSTSSFADLQKLITENIKESYKALKEDGGSVELTSGNVSGKIYKTTSTSAISSVKNEGLTINGATGQTVGDDSGATDVNGRTSLALPGKVTIGGTSEYAYYAIFETYVQNDVEKVVIKGAVPTYLSFPITLEQAANGTAANPYFIYPKNQVDTLEKKLVPTTDDYTTGTTLPVASGEQESEGTLGAADLAIGTTEKVTDPKYVVRAAGEKVGFQVKVPFPSNLDEKLQKAGAIIDTPDKGLDFRAADDTNVLPFTKITLDKNDESGGLSSEEVVFVNDTKADIGTSGDTLKTALFTSAGIHTGGTYYLLTENFNSKTYSKTIINANDKGSQDTWTWQTPRYVLAYKEANSDIATFTADGVYNSLKIIGTFEQQPTGSDKYADGSKTADVYDNAATNNIAEDRTIAEQYGSIAGSTTQKPSENYGSNLKSPDAYNGINNGWIFNYATGPQNQFITAKDFTDYTTTAAAYLKGVTVTFDFNMTVGTDITPDRYENNKVAYNVGNDVTLTDESDYVVTYGAKFIKYDSITDELLQKANFVLLRNVPAYGGNPSFYQVYTQYGWIKVTPGTGGFGVINNYTVNKDKLLWTNGTKYDTSALGGTTESLLDINAGIIMTEPSGFDYAKPNYNLTPLAINWLQGTRYKYGSKDTTDFVDPSEEHDSMGMSWSVDENGQLRRAQNGAHLANLVATQPDVTGDWESRNELVGLKDKPNRASGTGSYEYLLVEWEAPSGYVLMNQPVAFTVGAGSYTSDNKNQIEFVRSDGQKVTAGDHYAIGNVPKGSLPNTFSKAHIAIAILSLLGLIGAVVIWTKSRKENEIKAA
ncbi:MAG: hypothetical protein LBS33_04130 [Streptococcaceae bacterium]|jgi:hypothetical protein|nr:hypothetical protein [Streptococcaceae bacterium]